MKIPLIIAHGEEALLFIFGLGVLATLLGVTSIVAGARKRGRRFSTVGVVTGAISVLAGAGFTAIHRFRPPYLDLLHASLIAPLALGLVGFYLSMRMKKSPNKAPEPTPGAVTPRATEGDPK